MADYQAVLTAVMKFAAESSDFEHPTLETDPIDPPMDSFDDDQMNKISEKFHKSLLSSGIKTFVASTKMKTCIQWEQLAVKAHRNQPAL